MGENKKLVGTPTPDYPNPFKNLLKKKELKKGTIVPITEEEWNNFSGKAKWDCIVALRGPDLVGSNNAKFVTSSVIRHKMSGVMRVGGLVNSKFPFVVLPIGNVEAPPFDATHFCQHVWEAATYLGIPIIHISAASWKKLFLDTRSSKDVFLGLLKEEIPEEYKAIVKSYLGLAMDLPEDYS